MKKRKVFILLMIIVAIIIAIFTVNYFINKAKYDIKIEEVKEINYHIIYEDDKYGVINREGKIIVEPIYDIIQIPNPSKAVFICMSNYDKEQKEYEIKVLNEKSEELYTEYKNIQAIPTETTYDGIPFEKSVLKYKEGEKYGLISIDGKEITKAEYNEISAISYKEGMLLVKKDGLCGVINMNGKILIKLDYESITADNYYSKDTFYKTTGFIVSKKSDIGYRYGYINYKGQVVLETEYTGIERVIEIQDDDNVYLVAVKDGQAGLLKNKKNILNYEYEDIVYNLYNDVFVVQRNGKQGIVDRSGNCKIQPEYESIVFGGIYVNAQKGDEFFLLDVNGNMIENQEILSKIPTMDGKHYIVTDYNEVYKIVDENGNIVIDNNYTYIEEIRENYFVVGDHRKNGVIDLTGKAVIDLKYNSIFQLEGTELLQANISSTNTISLINKDMKILVTMDNANIEIADNYIRMYSETGNKYFDDTGKELTAKEVFPNNKLYAKQINEKWGFVDKNGDLKVKNEYDMVTEFNEYGFAGINKKGKWGVINSNGEIVQEPIYDIEWVSPNFIGKFYQSKEWRGDLYYTDKVEEEG